MSQIQMIITLIQLAAKVEPIIAAVLDKVIPALEALHVSKGTMTTLHDIKTVLDHHGLSAEQISNAAVRVGPVAEGPGLGASV